MIDKILSVVSVKTTEIYLVLLCFCISPPLFSQNLRLLESFDKIPLGTSRYIIEGLMSNFQGFSLYRLHDDWDIPERKYRAIDYNGRQGEELTLLFHEGILYHKSLKINYLLNEHDLAEEEYENIKNHIISIGGIVDTARFIISNKLYGGQVGESTTYYLNQSSEDYAAKLISKAGTLDFSFKQNDESAWITGYNVRYECVDLSKTSLDSANGYSLYSR